MSFLTNDEKWLLALYFKRMTFDDVLSHANCGIPYEEQKEWAYEVLGVVEKVQKELANEGIAPR
jgi:hypothetical protein